MPCHYAAYESRALLQARLRYDAYAMLPRHAEPLCFTLLIWLSCCLILPISFFDYFAAAIYFL